MPSQHVPAYCAERLAVDGGALVSPGEFYGDDGRPYVRVAVVQPDDRIDLVASRLRTAGRMSATAREVAHE